MPDNRQVLIHIRGDGINMPSISGTAAATCIPHTLHTFHLRFHALFSMFHPRLIYTFLLFSIRAMCCVWFRTVEGAHLTPHLLFSCHLSTSLRLQ